MAIFLTGSTGYVGAHVAALLLENHKDKLNLLVRAGSEQEAAERLWKSMQLHLDFPRETEEEGCLSFPDLRARITRPGQVKATLHTLDGTSYVVETDGLLARAIQHETDHLNGVLFIDRMNAAAKAAHRGKLRRMKVAARA